MKILAAEFLSRDLLQKINTQLTNTMTTKEKYQALAISLKNTSNIVEKKSKLQAIYKLVDGCSDEEQEGLFLETANEPLSEEEKALQSKIISAGLPSYPDFLARTAPTY